MFHLIFVILGALVMLAALAGFLRGLWAQKPRHGSSPASDWSSQSTGGDYSGHGGDADGGGH